MKKNKPVKILLLFLTANILLSSCASTTVIHSTPENAKVYLDNSFVGYTPYTLKDKKTSFSTRAVMLKKDGYDTFRTRIKKEGDVNVGAIVGGVFFYFPFIWILGYENEYVFELEEAVEE